MSGYTPERLRDYPRKDRWTAEESLATIQTVDGTDCIHGCPLPFYVQTTRDHVRGRIAFGLPRRYAGTRWRARWSSRCEDPLP
jgi:hypothetical protein